MEKTKQARTAAGLEKAAELKPYVQLTMFNEHLDAFTKSFSESLLEIEITRLQLTNETFCQITIVGATGIDLFLLGARMRSNGHY